MLHVSPWGPNCSSLTDINLVPSILLHCYKHHVWSTSETPGNVQQQPDPHIHIKFPSEHRTISLMKASWVYISLHSSACLSGLNGWGEGGGGGVGVIVVSPEACPGFQMFSAALIVFPNISLQNQTDYKHKSWQDEIPKLCVFMDR